jgi:tRNA (guanine37-N1)-methyltransferase
MYNFNIITLFPGFFDSPLSNGIMARGISESLISVKTHDMRDYSSDKHRKVDDYPYGGDEGMILMVDTVAAAIRDLRNPAQNEKVVMMTPKGHRYSQNKALEFSRLDGLILVCGRYEGFDERIRAEVDEEISLGDFILNGGEAAALALVESVGRLVPGVLGREATFESHSTGLLEYPQYTRPRVWEGKAVPDVLLTGDHGKIREWRYKASLARTYFRRPDMLDYNQLSQNDREFLARLSAGLEQEFEFIRSDKFDSSEINKKQELT